METCRMNRKLIDIESLMEMEEKGFKFKIKFVSLGYGKEN